MTMGNLVIIQRSWRLLFKDHIQNKLELKKRAHHAILAFSNFIFSTVKAIQSYMGVI